MHVEIRTLTPSNASEMLRRSTTRNRQLRTSLVRRYAREMQAGEWIENGQTITLTRSGDIVDGHHRLHALKDCDDVQLRMPVVLVDHPNAIVTVDVGRPRNIPDMFEMRLGINGTAAKIALALNRALFKNAASVQNHGPSGAFDRVYEVYLAHENGIRWALREGWNAVVDDPNRAKIRNTIRNGTTSPEFLWSCLAGIYQHNHWLAKHIIDDISQDNQSPSDLGVAMTRVMMWKVNNPGRRASEHWTYSRYISGLNHYIRGTSVMQISTQLGHQPVLRLEDISMYWPVEDC